MSNLELKRLDRSLKYTGNRITVYEDVYLLPDGKKINYDYVKNKDGSAVLLVDEEGKLIFVKQYRPVPGRVCLEIPAGSLEFEGEDFEACARREAGEETGYVPSELTFLAEVNPIPGFVEERTRVYIGTGLKKTERMLDAEEFIDVVKLTPGEARALVADGSIVDCKTIISIFAYGFDSKNVLK